MTSSLSIPRSSWGCSHSNRSGRLKLVFWSSFWTLAGRSLAWERDKSCLGAGLVPACKVRGLSPSSSRQGSSLASPAHPCIPWAGGAAGPQQSTETHWTSNQEGPSTSEFQVLAAELGAGTESVWEATVACSFTQAELWSHVCPCPPVAELCCLKLKKPYSFGESSLRQVLGTRISTSSN